MSGKRKVYRREYKEEAVRLSERSEKSVAEVEGELGLPRNLLVKWRGVLRNKGEEAFVGKGHQRTLEEENRRLKGALAQAEEERDILKKAVVYFVKETR